MDIQDFLESIKNEPLDIDLFIESFEDNSGEEKLFHLKECGFVSIRNNKIHYSFRHLLIDKTIDEKIDICMQFLNERLSR